jgi:hypothetical protein
MKVKHLVDRGVLTQELAKKRVEMRKDEMRDD